MEIVDNVTITNNVVENTLSGVFIGAAREASPKQSPSNVTISNNLFKNLGWRYAGGQYVDPDTGSGEEPFSFLVGDGSNITIDHNTLVTDMILPQGMAYGADMEGATGAVVLKNNIFKWGYDDPRPVMLTAFAAGNVMVGAPNVLPNFNPPDWQSVGFENYRRENYELAASSPYKNKATDSTPTRPSDPGANIGLLPAP